MVNLRGMALSQRSILNAELGPDQIMSYRGPESAPKKEESNMYSLELNPQDFPDGGFDAYLVLFGSFCGLIADFGIPNSLGAIEAYLSKNQLSKESLTSISWVFSLHLAVMYLGGGLFGDLFDRYGARKLLIAGTLCTCAGLVATAQLKELYQFILSFGILTAIGTSLAMSPLIGALSHWFLKKRGMACSVATVGGLVGASAFVLMLQKLYEVIGFKWAMRVFALVCFFCMSISIVLVRERTPQQGLHATSDQESVDSRAIETGASVMFVETEGQPLGVMGASVASIHETSPLKFLLFLDFSLFRDIRFVSLIVGVFLSEMMSMTILTYLASCALLFGVPQQKSYLLITVVNLFGIPSRIITGVIADKYGRFNVMVLTSLFSLVFILGIFLPAKGRLPILYAFAALFGCSNSAVLSLIGACVGQICPAVQFGKYYGLLYFCLAFLNLVGIYLTILVIGPGSQHNYQMWIIMQGSLALASVAAWIWARYNNVGFRMCKF